MLVVCETYVELIVRGHTARACGRTEGRTSDLVPSSQVTLKVELGVWDGVIARSVELRRDDIGSRRWGGLVVRRIGARVDHAGRGGGQCEDGACDAHLGGWFWVGLWIRD